MASDLLTVAEVKEHVTTGLSDAALERLIDAQDSYIRQIVGQHDPATTMVYEMDLDPGYQSIWLPRPAVSIATLEKRRRLDSAWTVQDAETYYLSDEGRSIQTTRNVWTWGWGWGHRFEMRVRVTYTPVPENAERTQALIDLVRLEMQDTGLEMERDDTYRYEAKDKTKARREIIAPLKRGYRMLA